MSEYYDSNGVTEAGLTALAAPFHSAQIEWRAQTVNTEKMWALMVPYVTARAVQSRFDRCCGPMNWKNSFREIKTIQNGGEVVNMLCGISVRFADEWVTKWDGATPTDIEGFKGSLSGAIRRAAVQWGPGRFLYDLEPVFVNISTEKDNSKERMNSKRVWYYYTKPTLPKWCDEDAEETPVNEPAHTVAGFSGSYKEILEAMKKRMVDDNMVSTVDGSPLIDAVVEYEGKMEAEKLVSMLSKYFEGEK